MSQIIRKRVIAQDDWTLAVEGMAHPPGSSKLIVPLARWRAEGPALAVSHEIGVLLPNTEDVEVIYAEVADRPLIALQFPLFTDGRALTQAVLLRNRLGFTGELRAVGDVVRDLSFWLGRCGFDTLVPRPDQSLEACRDALDEIRVAYQPAADAHVPIWRLRRRQAAA